MPLVKLKLESHAIVLPEFLAGSYKRYKEDTSLFTIWLAQAATACGWKSTRAKRYKQPQATNKEVPSAHLLQTNPGNPSSRLKGRERKATKAAAESVKQDVPVQEQSSPPVVVAKYAVTTKEILEQPRLVSGSDKQRMPIPDSLRSVVQRAIKARQHCNSWFEKLKLRNEHSDKQHLHFIEVLKLSLDLLESPSTKSQSLKPEPKEEKENQATTNSNLLAN